MLCKVNCLLPSGSVFIKENMPSTCYLCGRKTSRVDKISLHRFPKNPVLRNEWIKACYLDQSDDLRNVMLCSKHFNPDEIDRGSLLESRSNLKSNVVPSIGVPNKAFNKKNKKKYTLINFDSDNVSLNNETARTITHGNINENHNLSVQDNTYGISLNNTNTFANIINEINSVQNMLEKDFKQEWKLDIHTLTPSEHCDGFINQCELDIPGAYEETEVHDLKFDIHTLNGDNKSPEQCDNISKQIQMDISGANVETEVGPTVRKSPSKNCDDFIKQLIADISGDTAESEEDVNFGNCKENCSIVRKPRFFEPRYVSEIQPSDFITPTRGRIIVNLIRTTDYKKTKIIKSLRAHNRRLEERISSLNKTVANLKEDIAADRTEKSLLALLVGDDGSSFNAKDMGEYMPEIRNFATKLYFYSPKAYAYVRKSFNNKLPNPSTVRGWNRAVDEPVQSTNEILELNAVDESEKFTVEATKSIADDQSAAFTIKVLENNAVGDSDGFEIKTVEAKCS